MTVRSSTRGRATAAARAGTVRSTCEYRKPPSSTFTSFSSSSTSGNKDYYDDNRTAFGKILRGEAPAKVLKESDRLLAFWDRRPRAPFHALVVPKRSVPTIRDLLLIDETASDGNDNDNNNLSNTESLELLYEMKQMAEQLVEEYRNDDNDVVDVVENNNNVGDGDYRLCFHVPPFNSVNHLHLHVLAPASRMTWFNGSVKYNSKLPWCADVDDVIRAVRELIGKQQQQQKRTTTPTTTTRSKRTTKR